MPVLPMYMPGLLRTASSPSRTVIWSASYCDAAGIAAATPFRPADGRRVPTPLSRSPSNYTGGKGPRVKNWWEQKARAQLTRGIRGDGDMARSRVVCRQAASAREKRRGGADHPRQTDANHHAGRTHAPKQLRTLAGNPCVVGIGPRPSAMSRLETQPVTCGRPRSDSDDGEPQLAAALLQTTSTHLTREVVRTTPTPTRSATWLAAFAIPHMCVLRGAPCLTLLERPTLFPAWFLPRAWSPRGFLSAGRRSTVGASPAGQ